MAVTANQLIQRQDGCKGTAPVAASTQIYQGTLVFGTSTGYADDDTASGRNSFLGVAIGEKDNSSGSAGDLNVDLWKDGTFELTGSGFSQASVGKDVYATDNYTVTTTLTEAGVKIGTVDEYVSATAVRVRIDTGLSSSEVKTISESLAFGDFTDNANTTGYKDWSAQLPAGAIVLGVKYVVATGFTGDTTAVVQTGVSGDLDRFSSVTDQSVLAAGTVGHGVAADAHDGIGAAQTIRTTVTGASDFGGISAGAMVATLYYIQG